MSHAPAVQSLQGPPSMGRKRTINHGLPPRMQRKGNGYYYVSNAPRKWTPLGPDLAKAKRLWAEMEGGSNDLSVADLVQRYLDRETRSHSTALQYKSYLKALALAFPIPVRQLRSQHVAIWRELPEQRKRKSQTNGCISLLMSACKLGHEQGECDPIAVSMWGVEGRDRYLSDAEFVAIRAHAPAWLQVAMDVAYLTASRPIDIRALKWESVGEALGMRQIKTRQRMAFTMTPELADVLAQARRRPVLGLYVCATDKGRKITEARMGKDWRVACVAASVSDAQFRDIRSKAATDAARGGQDFQALLGHTTRAMSERYIKDRRTVHAEPVRRKL